jgi:ribonuclease HI
MSFYAVANGKTIGIFTNWSECSESVKGFKNAKYKKFTSLSEAEDFIYSYQSENSTSNNFTADYYVYTDGACSKNGAVDALAGIGIFFGIDDPRNVSKRIEGKQTNNVAELMALIEAFHIIQHDIVNNKKICVVSDSEYAIKCVTTYGKKCEDKKWNVTIPNKDLVQNAYSLYKDCPNVNVQYVKAHTNSSDCHSIGNYHADKLANYSIIRTSNQLI